MNDHESVELVSPRVQLLCHPNPLLWANLARIFVHQHLHLQVGECLQLGHGCYQVLKQLSGLKRLGVVPARAFLEHDSTLDTGLEFFRLVKSCRLHTQGSAGVYDEDAR